MRIKQKAETYMKTMFGTATASLHKEQLECLKQLLKGKRVLVVQHPGWGKRTVCFLATKLIREQAGGPTLVISPLTSAVRNHLEVASRIGITSRIIKGTSSEACKQVQSELKSNQVDLLIVSPKQVSDYDVRQTVLAQMDNTIGMLVIGEVHCISEWSHDFRPEYRYLAHFLQAIGADVPVLATTATAKNRVVDDILTQLGSNAVLQRGTLAYKGLKLQNITIPGCAQRLAWLAKTIPTLKGNGIVYTHNQRVGEQVTNYLRANGVEAKMYYTEITDGEDKRSFREKLEQQLLNNEIKVLVATVSCLLGVDESNLGFVIHYQRPASVVHYYQQLACCGRTPDESYGVLLCGEEDGQIAEYFLKKTIPPQQHVPQILRALEASNEGLTIAEMKHVLNLRKNQIEKAITYLSTEKSSPVTKVGSKWHVKATCTPYKVDREHVQDIIEVQHTQQRQMLQYMHSSECLMAFLQTALDEPSPTACGRCRNCDSALQLDETYDDELVKKAEQLLRTSYQTILPKKQWPAKDMFTRSPLSGFRIVKEQRAQEGRALSLWHDGGWGRLVATDMRQANRFCDELVEACRTMLHTWSPDPFPQWVTCVPSLRNPTLVPEFAARLAKVLNVPFVPCIEKTCVNAQQKYRENSYQQVKNLDGAFTIHLQPQDRRPCLLVDDVLDSGWTFTVVSALLGQAGCPAVYPMALAVNSPRMS